MECGPGIRRKPARLPDYSASLTNFSWYVLTANINKHEIKYDEIIRNILIIFPGKVEKALTGKNGPHINLPAKKDLKWYGKTKSGPD